MIRTFIDAGVLIVAAHGEDGIAERAIEILKDPNREFASSLFLKLEVLPKAIYRTYIQQVFFENQYLLEKSLQIVHFGVFPFF